MTTIAFRDGVMAADTQITESSLYLRGSKLVRLPCGGVAGGCGNYSDLHRAMSWLAAGGKGKGPKLASSEVLVAYGDGRIGSYSGKWVFMPLQSPVAAGSGSQAAMAAMNHYGATAAEAVMAAATADPNTSAPVDVMRVEPAKRRGKKK